MNVARSAYTPATDAGEAVRVVALTRGALWDDVGRLAAAHGLHVEFAANTALFVARVESEAPECVLVDAGALDGASRMLRFARSLWPASQLVAVTPWWSDEEALLRSVADIIVHVPIRVPEWEAAFCRVHALLRG